MGNFWLRTSLHLCKERLVIAMECFQPNLSPVTFLNTVLDILHIHFQYGVFSNSWPGYFGVQRSLLPTLIKVIMFAGLSSKPWLQFSSPQLQYRSFEKKHAKFSCSYMPWRRNGARPSRNRLWYIFCYMTI